MVVSPNYRHGWARGYDCHHALQHSYKSRLNKQLEWHTCTYTLPSLVEFRRDASKNCSRRKAAFSSSKICRWRETNVRYNQTVPVLRMFCNSNLHSLFHLHLLFHTWAWRGSNLVPSVGGALDYWTELLQPIIRGGGGGGGVLWDALSDAKSLTARKLVSILANLQHSSGAWIYPMWHSRVGRYSCCIARSRW